MNIKNTGTRLELCPASSTGATSRRLGKLAKAVLTDEALPMTQLQDGTFNATLNNLTVSGTLTASGMTTDSVAPAITAKAGGGQDATLALSKNLNIVTTVATAADSVTLPSAAAGLRITVVNLGANALAVFPYTSDSINDAAADASVTQDPETSVTYNCYTGVLWQSDNESLDAFDKIYVGDGTVSLPSYTFTGDKDSGVYIIGANNLGVAVAGAKVLDVATTGLGITGTATVSSTTDSTTKDTGAITTEGGIGVEKAIVTGTSITAGTSLASGTTLTAGTTSNLVGVVTFGAGNVYKALTTQTALAGGAQAGTALTAEYTDFTVVVTALDSAQLPTPVLGTRRIVKNTATSKLAMVVFGQTGATIDGGATNAGVIVGYGEEVVFDAVSATAWKTNRNSPVASSIITEERTLTATEIVGTAAGDLGHASGAELVSAPGAGYMLEFISAVCMYDFDTAAYTGGANDTSIRIGSGGAALTGAVTDANSLTAAGDKIYSFVPLSTAALPLSTNTGISMNATTAYTQPGTAAGVLRVQTSYRIHKTGL